MCFIAFQKIFNFISCMTLKNIWQKEPLSELCSVLAEMYEILLWAKGNANLFVK